MEAAVIAAFHPKWQERPLACIAPFEQHRGSITKQEILDFLCGGVAKWWLPDDIVFIETVPKTGGKFNKRALRSNSRIMCCLSPMDERTWTRRSSGSIVFRSELGQPCQNIAEHFTIVTHQPVVIQNHLDRGHRQIELPGVVLTVIPALFELCQLRASYIEPGVIAEIIGISVGRGAIKVRLNCVEHGMRVLIFILAVEWVQACSDGA